MPSGTSKFSDYLSFYRMTGQITGCELNSLTTAVASLPIFFYFICHPGNGGGGALGEAQGRRHACTADEGEDHICINTFVGELCQELTGGGWAWQVYHTDQLPLEARTDGREVLVLQMWESCSCHCWEVLALRLYGATVCWHRQWYVLARGKYFRGLGSSLNFGDAECKKLVK